MQALRHSPVFARLWRAGSARPVAFGPFKYFDSRRQLTLTFASSRFGLAKSYSSDRSTATAGWRHRLAHLKRLRNPRELRSMWEAKTQEEKVPLVVSIVALALLVATALAGVLYTLRDTLAVPDKMFMEMVDDVFDQCDVDKSGAIDEKELYVAILLVHNKINKKVPGFVDCPTKEQVMALLKVWDKDENGSLDKEEFEAFARSLCDVEGVYMHQLLRHVATTVIVLPLLGFSLKTLLSQSAILRPAVSRLPVSILAPSIGAMYGMVRALQQGDYLMSGMADESRITPMLSEHAASLEHNARALAADSGANIDAAGK